tara:strand:+ start:887 stop:1057 length:171 start_codon:yes stop_codon:yes gene_type:complete
MKNKVKNKEDKDILEEICSYISDCSDRELYFIKKSIEFRREKNQKINSLFEGSTLL